MKTLAIALALAFVLAGCTSGKGGDEDDDTTGTTTSTKTGSSTGSTTRSSTGTTTGSGGAGTIQVDLTRSTPNGPVPLAVNFTLNATFKDGSGKTVAVPTSASWNVTIVAGNGTNATNVTQGPTGKTLPANFTLNFTQVGNHTVRATVTATGFAGANDTVLIGAVAGGAGVPLFFDGAEGDGSQWTFTNEFVLDVPLVGRFPSEEEHPLGGWEANEDEFKAGAMSWHAPYPDHYEARMTSVATPSPASKLTYWVKGGSEGNDVDGLYVYAGPDAGSLTEIAFHGGAAIDWTQSTLSLPSGTKVVRFLMLADASCSSDPVPVGGADDLACGPGWDAGGFYVDDVTMT